MAIDHKDEDPRELVASLCKDFYKLGWVTGTGGGVSVKKGDSIFLAPSGVQKERIKTDEVFIVDFPTGAFRFEPEGLKCTECYPLFMSAFRLRGAGAVIHSHSQNAFMATLMYPGKEFVVTHMEMIKGLRNAVDQRAYRYDEKLVIPIIENTCFEKDLTESLTRAMSDYPAACAVLVRRHGLYVWGDTWQKAKTHAECLDYLFETACKMKAAGFDPTAPE
ncbi:probable methylthioribulose-1-phosphate dehydratase [Galendromus occidentalis]|uniref:Probable methylthioribulose-1-phosphate dehydratase n=1 Tax=Galendromus occidentalis TaxID=34638 RepID=A0AAJ6QLV4_9ACAR|nr:probable methylthioribulose-1-phosphate dehydratase [Galendromus occidentalis]